MKKLSCYILFGFLTACTTNDNVSYTPYHGSDISSKEDFYNAAAVENSNITGMISRNQTQVKLYIQNRLQRYIPADKVAAEKISDIDVANTALKLSNATEEEIANMYLENEELVRQALYITNSSVANKCWGATTASGVASCYIIWRNSNPKALDALYKNAQILTIDEASFDATDGTKLKFNINKESGQIIGISVLDGENVINISDNVSAGQFWTSLPNKDMMSLDYISLGKKYNLSYSDFGVYGMHLDTPVENGFEHKTLKSNIPFAGGYESHKIATTDIATDIHFTGYAVGNVTNDTQRVELAGNATLDFDKATGTSALGASFNNWYDINVTSDGTIEFSNYTNTNNLVKLDAAPNDNGVITDTGTTMDVGYYAPVPATGIPTEATGLIQYTETASGVKMDIAFGAK